VRLSVGPLARGAALGLLLALCLPGCQDRCPRIEQTIFITPPNAELEALIAPCVARTPAPGEACTHSTAVASGGIECGCLALCRRVLEITNQFSGPPAIEACQYYASTGTPTGDGGTDALESARVDVSYRPASCP